MNVSSLQKKLSFPVGEVMAALLVAQPLLDVLSYFMGQADATWLTTALRTVLLFAVGVYGFSITENRRAYYVMYGVVGGFWVLHMLSCLRLGYQDPYYFSHIFRKVMGISPKEYQNSEYFHYQE